MRTTIKLFSYSSCEGGGGLCGWSHQEILRFEPGGVSAMIRLTMAWTSPNPRYGWTASASWHGPDLFFKAPRIILSRRQLADQICDCLASRQDESLQPDFYVGQSRRFRTMRPRWSSFLLLAARLSGQNGI